MAGPVERAFVASPIASAGNRVITSPFQFYTSGEDHLRLTVVNSAAGVVVTLRGRFVDSAGLITPIAQDLVATTDRTATSIMLQLGVGAVLNIDVFVSSGTPQRGQTYVIVQLLRGLGGAAIVLGTLLRGYVTANQHQAWPGSPLEHSFEGPGVVRLIVGTNPGAGVEISELVPTGARWRLIHVIAQLVTNAAVAARVPYLSPFVGGTRMGFYPPAASIPASFAQYVQWATGYTTWTVGGTTAQAASLASGLLLPSGSQLQTFTENLQAADDWGTPELLVEEWLEVT
jgi:hypothetical protein